MNFIAEIKGFIQRNGIIGKWIAAFSVAYLVQILVFIFSYSFGNGAFYKTFSEYICLTTGGLTPLFRPWTLFTYVFVYTVSPMGILFFIFNMLFFWTFAAIFKQTIGEERLKRFLWIGIPAIGLLMSFWGLVQGGMVATNSSLIVFIVFAVAALLPDYPINFWMIPVKMKWLAPILLLLNLTSYLLSPMGIACILAAILGVAYIKLLQSGTDILEIMWHWFESFDLGKNKKYAPHIKVVYKEDLEQKAQAEITQAEIDSILDKINEKGFANLSQAEKDTLARFSGKRKQDV